ncbi:MAG: hypothetical protein N3F04_04500 [Candidatus Nezhaarchaeota archaeon]|nr:hypothetical protein [Candidatus Nezhaarchaeota archaeon]
MSKRVIAVLTIASLALALLLVAIPVCAETETVPLILRLKYYNGTVPIDLAGENVTIRINGTLYSHTAITNATGHIVLPAAPYTRVNVSVWWNAKWGVSYFVNFTGYVDLTNGTEIYCQVFNINLMPLDNASKPLPYAIVRVLDVNATRIAYDVGVGPAGLTGGLKAPIPLNETNPQQNATYYFRVTVFWTPTTPVGMLKVYNVTKGPVGIYNASVATNTTGFARLNCSVYYITIQPDTIVDERDRSLNSSGDLVILADIYYKGMLVSSQGLVVDGGTKMRVATEAVDERPGEGTLRSGTYEFRVYWRWQKPSIEYLVNVSTTLFGDIIGNISFTTKINTSTVVAAIRLVDKNYDGLALADVEITFPVYGYKFITDSSPLQGLLGCVDWTPIHDMGYYRSDVMPLPTRHNGSELTFRIKVTFDGVKVLDGVFKPADHAKWVTHPLGFPMLNLVCDVYWVQLTLLDARNMTLSGNATLTIRYPAEGVDVEFLVVNGIAGRRLPGGSGLTATISYKDVYGLPALEPVSFNISDASTSITLRFPVYNLVLYVNDWYGKPLIGPFDCNITFTKAPWAGITQSAWYNATGNFYVFEQLPKGGNYSIRVLTRPGAPLTPGFNATGALGKLLGALNVTMPGSDHTASIRLPVYNPRLVIKAIDGSDIPAALAGETYVVIRANTSTIEPIYVNKTVDITYVSNQTLGACFVGGWVYPIRVYIAGVVVYDGVVSLPDPSVATVITLRVNLYPSLARVLTYDLARPIPNISIRIGWVGLNVTNFTAPDLLTRNWATSPYVGNFTGVANYSPYTIPYCFSAVTGVAGNATFWIPVWNITGLNYTTIVYGVYTIPGVTGGVPATAPSVAVGPSIGERLGITGVLTNITAVVKDIGNITAYAYNFYVRVLNYLGEPLANYTVFVNGTYVDGRFIGTIASTTTNATGVASFISGIGGIFFFANYTYDVGAFLMAAPYPQIVLNRTALNASVWRHGDVVTIRFPGALIVKALDWEGNPLAGAEVRLFWATGPYAGRLTAVAKTGKDGVATIMMNNVTDVYTVEVWWKGSIVNREYRLEEQLDFSRVPPVFSYTERMMVYNPRITLVSDRGLALPAEVTVKVTWPDGDVSFHWTDATGSVMLTQAPIGQYRVESTWKGIKIYDSLMWIESSAPMTLRTAVYSVDLSFLTPRGTPLNGATVLLRYPDGTEATVILDSEGKASLPLVPADAVRNVLTVLKVTWLDSAITLKDSRATIRASGPVTFYAANVHALLITVVGALGQPLDGATVVILRDNKTVATIVAEGGIAKVELPKANYTVQALYLGKKGEASVSLVADTTVKVPLDVFIVIGNVAFSTSEVILWTVIAIVVIIALAAIIISLTRIGRKKAATG